MNIVFMGTPDFAVPSLQALIEKGHNILAVVATPDKQRGRGQKVTFTPVKNYAVAHNIPVLQPVSLKDDKFIIELKQLNPELFVVVAFRILPKEVYTIPSKGAINLHGSLLPKYRGAAPIQWAIMNGESETGVTTFFLQDKVDTGNIIISEKIPIEADDNFGSLHDKMSHIGASVVVKTVELIGRGDIQSSIQDNTVASGAPKITKEICMLDWNKETLAIHNQIRGLSPYPGAFFIHNDKQVKIFKTRPVYDKKLSPGEIIQTRNQAFIGCLDGAVELLEIQQEGHKRMNIEEFLRGYRF